MLEKIILSSILGHWCGRATTQVNRNIARAVPRAVDVVVWVAVLGAVVPVMVVIASLAVTGVAATVFGTLVRVSAQMVVVWGGRACRVKCRVAAYVA